MGYEGSYLWKLRRQIGHALVLVPSAAVVVEDVDERILLLRRGDTGGWATPAGSAEEGSTFADTALAELREETGLIAEKEDLIPFACMSDPAVHLMRYPNGDLIHAFGMWFALRTWTGEPRPDGTEALELRFFRQDQLPENLMPAAKRAIGLYRRFKESSTFQVS